MHESVGIQARYATQTDTPVTLFKLIDSRYSAAIPPRLPQNRTASLTAPRRVTLADALTETTVDACVHHWLIGQPSGDSTPARCKRCGTERIFPSSPERAGLRAKDASKTVAH